MSNIDGQVVNGTLFVALAGELDEHACSLIRLKFDNMLDMWEYRCVVVDLTQLAFMDSSGIGLLIGRFKKLKSRNIPLMISNPCRAVDKVFRVSGIYQMIPLIG